VLVNNDEYITTVLAHNMCWRQTDVADWGSTIYCAHSFYQTNLGAIFKYYFRVQVSRDIFSSTCAILLTLYRLQIAYTQRHSYILGEGLHSEVSHAEYFLQYCLLECPYSIRIPRSCPFFCQYASM